jgi:hypothetical protein
MHSTLRKCHPGWLCAALAAACLSACGSANSSADTAGITHRGPAKAHRPPPKPADPTAGMSTAVATMKGASGINVKFQLESRPAVGQPLSVDFALVPDPSVVAVSGKFDGDDGLKLLDGAQLPVVEKPAPGTPIRHTVTVVPSKDGIYTVTASLMVTAAGDDARLHTFAIPIIAGDGLPHLSAHADLTPADH